MCTVCRCVGGLGSAVVTGDKDGRLQVWDMDLGQVASQLHAHKGMLGVSMCATHCRVCLRSSMFLVCYVLEGVLVRERHQFW